MSQTQLDRIEETLDSLVTTVAGIMEMQTEMKNEQTSMKDGQNAMQQEMSSMKDGQNLMQRESNTRHQEVMEKLKSLEADQEHIWEKAARNEREFARFKHQYEF